MEEAQINKIKKILIITTALLSIPYPVIYALKTNSDQAIAAVMGISRYSAPVLFSLMEYILLTPFVILVSGILFYLASNKIYKTWLWWTGIILTLMTLNIAMYDPGGYHIGPSGPEALLVVYAAGSAILLFVALIGRLTQKNKV